MRKAKPVTTQFLSSLVETKMRGNPRPKIPSYGALLNARMPVQHPSHGLKAGPETGTLKPSPVYTGDKVLGVAVMHKSSMVPVFSAEEAIDIATMRRN